MTLKFRYAGSLILILLVICIFTWFIARSAVRGDYLIALSLTALLYVLSFLLGKKFRKIFFLLSTIKYIKTSNGVASITAIENHIKRGGKNSEELAKEIIDLLVSENVVQQQGDQLMLTGE